MLLTILSSPCIPFADPSETLRWSSGLRLRTALRGRAPPKVIDFLGTPALSPSEWRDERKNSFSNSNFRLHKNVETTKGYLIKLKSNYTCSSKHHLTKKSNSLTLYFSLRIGFSSMIFCFIPSRVFISTLLQSLPHLSLLLKKSDIWEIADCKTCQHILAVCSSGSNLDASCW